MMEKSLHTVEGILKELSVVVKPAKIPTFPQSVEEIAYYSKGGNDPYCVFH